MIISHSKKFIFVHVFKVAGNNIRTELNKYNHTRSKKNTFLSFIGLYPSIYSSDFDSHITANDIRRRLNPKIFNAYYKFAFVRNPWDWQVSLYHYTKQNKDHFQHNIIKDMSFDEYLHWRVNYDQRHQKDFVYNERGELLVNFIGKLENLQNDFDLVCTKLKIPKRKLTVKNSSIHKDYRYYYNEELIKLVQEAFAEDIRLFNYSFENEDFHYNSDVKPRPVS